MPVKKPGPSMAERALAARENIRTSNTELNLALQKAQEKLVGLAMGVSAYADMSSESQREHDHHTWLVFRRYQNKWRLVLSTGPDEPDTPEEVTPLENATQDERRRAAGLIDELLANMVEKAEAEHQKNLAAVSALRDIVNLKVDAPAAVPQDDFGAGDFGTGEGDFGHAESDDIPF